MKRIAIFASGSGTNTEKIIDYFKEKENIEVALVLSNRPDAGVLKIAEKNEVPILIIEKKVFYETDDIVKHLIRFNIDFIVLAGFLWMIPENLIAAFKNKMINIHPALLPKYGGKGMYGVNVHKAVIASGEKETGISIHHINEYYDEGQIIFQARCEIEKEDTPETIAKKVQALEHKYFPMIIEEIILKNHIPKNG